MVMRARELSDSDERLRTACPKTLIVNSQQFKFYKEEMDTSDRGTKMLNSYPGTWKPLNLSTLKAEAEGSLTVHCQPVLYSKTCLKDKSVSRSTALCKQCGNIPD